MKYPTRSVACIGQASRLKWRLINCRKVFRQGDIFSLACLVTVFFLLGCSSSIVTVQIAPQAPLRSFRLALLPIKISPTLADASLLVDPNVELNSKVRSELERLKFEFVEQSAARAVLHLVVATDSTDATTDDDLRFRKGTRLSRFPDPNPRVRNFEADYLLVDVATAGDGKVLYKAKCQLIPNQQIQPGADHGKLVVADVVGCVRQLFE